LIKPCNFSIFRAKSLFAINQKLINNIEIAIFAREVAPAQAGQALGAYDFT